MVPRLKFSPSLIKLFSLSCNTRDEHCFPPFCSQFLQLQLESFRNSFVNHRTLWMFFFWQPIWYIWEIQCLPNGQMNVPSRFPYLFIRLWAHCIEKFVTWTSRSVAKKGFGNHQTDLETDILLGICSGWENPVSFQTFSTDIRIISTQANHDSEKESEQNELNHSKQDCRSFYLEILCSKLHNVSTNKFNHLRANRIKYNIQNNRIFRPERYSEFPSGELGKYFFSCRACSRSVVGGVSPINPRINTRRTETINHDLETWGRLTPLQIPIGQVW